ncbi:MAG: hypothetical protein SOZ59_10700 [Candidatus Limivivens sp.]|nr:hypothetical protein [Candidatus Limivivens sp.]
MAEQQKKRYESDLTSKEKRQLEKEKLMSMGWKGRVEYIWMYYKPVMAAIAGVILFIIFMVDWVDNMKNQDILYAVVINGLEGDADAAAEDFKAYLGDEDERHIVTFDNSLQSYGDQMTDYATQTKMLALIAAGSMDVLICPEETYEHYKEQETFFDLKEVLDPELYEELSEYIVGDAILIQDSAKWQSLGMTSYEPVYLGVVVSGKNTEQSVELIKYLFQE